MAAVTVDTINLGVGGYKLPPQLMREATEAEAVVSFYRGREGNAIGKAADGRIVLPARRAPIQPLPGEVWKGRMWAHSSGRYYIFEPETCIVARRKAPEFVTVDTPVTKIQFVKLRDATGKARVVVVSEKTQTLVADNVILHISKLAEIARRFTITNTVTYRGALESIQNLKVIYGAENVNYDSAKLKQLFRGIEDSAEFPEFAHSHRLAVERHVQPDPRDKESNTVIAVERCTICGRWTVTEPGRFSQPERRMGLSRRLRGSRITPKKRKPARKQNLPLRQRGMHRRKVVHARKRWQRKW